MSVALITFIGIVAYHITNLKPVKTALRRSCCYRKVIQYGTKMNSKFSTLTFITDAIDTSNFPQYEPFNEERESLLATD